MLQVVPGHYSSTLTGVDLLSGGNRTFVITLNYNHHLHLIVNIKLFNDNITIVIIRRNIISLLLLTDTQPDTTDRTVVKLRITSHTNKLFATSILPPNR